MYIQHLYVQLRSPWNFSPISLNDASLYPWQYSTCIFNSDLQKLSLIFPFSYVAQSSMVYVYVNLRPLFISSWWKKGQTPVVVFKYVPSVFLVSANPCSWFPRPHINHKALLANPNIVTQFTMSISSRQFHHINFGMSISTCCMLVISKAPLGYISSGVKCADWVRDLDQLV